SCFFFYVNFKIVYCQEDFEKMINKDPSIQLLSDLKINDVTKKSILKTIFDQTINFYLVSNEIVKLHKENLELRKVLDENAFKFFCKNIREKIFTSLGKECIIETDELYFCILDIGLEKITNFKSNNGSDKIETTIKIVEFLVQDLLLRQEKKQMNWMSHYVCFLQKMNDMPENKEEFFGELFLKLNI